MRSTARLLPSALVVALALTMGAARSPAQMLTKDAALCQQTIGKGGQAFKKAKLKAWQKCLDGILLGKGCDASGRDVKIATAAQKASAKIAAKCTPALLFPAPPAGAGFAQTCALESGPVEPAEAQCAALAVNDPASLAQCLICWKEAEIDELLQILYPCLVAQVPAGSDLDCGTPPAACPTDKIAINCTRTIAKAGINFFLAKEKALEKCLDAVNKGAIPGPCPDGTAAAKIGKAEQKKVAQIQKCTQVPPWWDVCPEDPTSPCDQTITSVADIATCVDGAAEAIADEVVCQQYPGAPASGIACPPGETTTSTTTTSTTTTTTTSTTSTTVCTRAGDACFGEGGLCTGTCANLCDHGCALACVAPFRSGCTHDSDCNPFGPMGAICVASNTCPDGCTNTSNICALPCNP